MAKPVAPMRPMRWPFPTLWPRPTYTLAMWLYVVYSPEPWAIQTW